MQRSQDLLYRQPISPIKPIFPRRFELLTAVTLRVAEWLYQLGEYAQSARHYQATAVLLSGKEKHSQHSLSTFYFGAEQNLDYLIEQLYGDYIVEEKHEGLKIWGIKGWLQCYAQRADLVIADLPWPYLNLLPRTQFIEVPAWIGQKLPLANHWDEVLSRFRKNTKTTDLRKIRKYQLGYRLTSDPVEIDAFYDRMYIPYIKSRFGDLALVDPRWEIHYFCTELLQVTRDHQVIAGSVLFHWRKTMHFLWIGIPERLDNELFSGAFSALYYYAIQHAYEQGCDEIDFSTTRPLLNSGIYRYKRKWGASVYNTWSRGNLLLRPNSFSPGVQSFFVHHPWLVRKGRRLVGKILVADEELSSKDVARIAETYASDGLECLKIFALRKLSDEVKQADYSNLGPLELFDLSQTSDPVAAFCCW